MKSKMRKRNGQKYRCRCLRCGKQTLERRPQDGCCPNCGAYCAPATVATKAQARALAGKAWKPVNVQPLADAIGELGLVVEPISDGIKTDLGRIAKRRHDPQFSSHLYAHRFVVDRPGMANGDLKSKSALKQALGRTASTPKFVGRPEVTSPAVLGKLIEAELEFRTNRRKMRSLSMASRTLRFVHPVLGPSTGEITVEIDGSSDELPVELKTVATMESLLRYRHKVRDMLMQLAGQALASGVDSGILLVAEREGDLLTAVEVSGLRDFHIRNIRKWMEELDIGFARKEHEVFACD